MSDDILGRIDQVVSEHESCPCGRELPEAGTSLYWCSEACQLSWTNHQADPAVWPHPRDVRERMEQLRADRAPGRRTAVRLPPEDTTPMSGMGCWTTADEAPSQVGAYRRWCPTCQARQAWVIVDDPDAYARPQATALLDDRPSVQECQSCHHRWPGRPLIGTVEVYHGPGFRDLLRLRLSDGYRSASRLVPQRLLELWRAPEVMLALEWESLEETFQAGRLPPWDWLPALPAPSTRDIVRITSVT